MQQFLRNKQGILEQMRVIDTRPHRHGHLNSIRDNEHRNGHRKAKNWRIREAADAKKSHFFLIFPWFLFKLRARKINFQQQKQQKNQQHSARQHRERHEI